MNFTFLHRTELVCRRGAAADLPALLAARGRRALLVTGAASLATTGRLERITAGLTTAQLEFLHLSVADEPTDVRIDQLTEKTRAYGPDCVLAVGGGSALDAGKALAALATNPGPVADYLEGVPGGAGASLDAPALPVVAAPTTAGTGSEATRNAVIQVEDLRAKRSLRAASMLPTVAVLDPELLAGAPRPVEAAAAFDAFGHLLESLLSTGASPVTDALAWPALDWAWGFLQSLVHGAIGPESRARMGLAACHGGICLSNARLGAVHGLVAPLGGRLGLAHGAGVAWLLPRILLADRRAFLARAPAHPAFARLEQVALRVCRRPSVREAALVLEELRRELGLPDPAGLDAEAAAAVIAAPSGSIRSNPIELSADELSAALQEPL